MAVAVPALDGGCCAGCMCSSQGPTRLLKMQGQPLPTPQDWQDLLLANAVDGIHVYKTPQYAGPAAELGEGAFPWVSGGGCRTPAAACPFELCSCCPEISSTEKRTLQMSFRRRMLLWQHEPILENPLCRWAWTGLVWFMDWDLRQDPVRHMS